MSDPNKLRTNFQPTDAERRRLFVAAILPPPGSATTPAERPPVPLFLKELPDGAVRFVLLPVERTARSAALMGEVFVEMDLRRLDGLQLQQLNVPNAASACFVASAQARAVRQSDLVQGACWVQPDLLDTLNEKHTELRRTAEGVRQYLVGVAGGRVAVLAARTLAQEHLRAWFKQEIARLPAGDKRRADLESRLKAVEALEAQKKAQEQQSRDKTAEERDAALSLLDETEEEYLFAATLSAMRRGEIPDAETLRRATRYLKLHEQRHGTPPADARAAPRANARRTRKTT